MSDFEQQFEKIRKSLLFVAIRYLKNIDDAEDMVQETAITGYRVYTTLKNSQQFKTWITRILINKCIDYIRKENIRKKYEEQTKDIIKFNTIIEFPINEIEMINLVYVLPLVLKKCIILKFYKGYTYKEIANILNMPESTVKEKTKKALLLLRDLIE